MRAVIFVLVAAILSVYNNECTFINIKYRAPSCIMIIILPAYTINSISSFQLRLMQMNLYGKQNVKYQKVVRVLQIRIWDKTTKTQAF